MAQEDATDYGQEQTSFGSRETGLAAMFAAAPERVFAAMEVAAEQQGLAVLTASAANGLLVARPSVSLLNLGRRVTVTFSPAGAGRTLAKASYTHGLVSFQDRYQRLELLADLFRSARNHLAAGQAVREAAARPDAPAAQPEAAAILAGQETATSPAPPSSQAPAGPATRGAPSGQAPAAAPATQAPSPQAPADAGQPPQPHPTLREIKARARAEELARMRAAGQDPEAASFLKEDPEGFRLPRQFKARRFFWFALGVILAVVLVALMRLASG